MYSLYLAYLTVDQGSHSKYTGVHSSVKNSIAFSNTTAMTAKPAAPLAVLRSSTAQLITVNNR